MAESKRTFQALVADLEHWITAGIEAAANRTVGDIAQSKTEFHAGSWCIVCVGEAAGQILKHYSSSIGENLRIELTLANAARNRVAHGYYDLDEEQVWKTLTVSFPKLGDMLKQGIGKQ